MAGLSNVRLRAVATLSVIASTGLVALTGCDSNVGVAAKVGGQTISESDVSSYLTAHATPFSDSGQNVQPKIVVLTDLIRDDYARQLLGLTNGGTPSPSSVQDAEGQVLQQQQTSRAQIVSNYTQRGFSASAADLAIRTNALFSILSDRLGNNAQQFVSQHPIPVSVDPRFGTWDEQSLSVNGAIEPGLPFLKLQSSNGAGGQSAVSQ